MKHLPNPTPWNHWATPQKEASLPASRLAGQSKVPFLQQAVRNGSYFVPAELLADRLLLRYGLDFWA